MLAVRGLCKAFGGVTALDHVTFAVGAGESVGLVGPNGAGKTTVFDCVCGEVRPDAGTVELAGRDLRRSRPFRRARLGIGRTYQRLEVFPELTVREHLLVAERARRGDGRLWKDLCNRSAPKPEELARVGDVLALLDIGGVADVPVAALGLGMCRLVELGRALVREPRILLADEPSSGLDADESGRLGAVLRRLQAERGMAVLLVEHDLGIVSEVVDRVVVMDAGRVVAEGRFDDVMTDPAVRHAYLGAR